MWSISLHLSDVFFFLFSDNVNLSSCNLLLPYHDPNQLFCAFFVSEVSSEDVMKKLEKRSNETTVRDARARYLQRKKDRQQSKAL